MQTTVSAETPAALPNTTEHLRGIRSFVKRGGRLGPGQRRAWDELGPRFVVERKFEPGVEPLDMGALFGRDAPLLLEIGFGMGEATAAVAAARPDWNVLGVEVYEPGVGALLKRVGEAQLANIRIVAQDAVKLVRHGLSERSLDAVHIYFPDPWHKKRHHKRRLVQPPFVSELAQRIKPGGYLHLATDWQHYAEHMLDVLGQEPLLRNRASPSAGGYAERPAWRPPSKFEQRGLRLGHGVWDLLFERV